MKTETMGQWTLQMAHIIIITAMHNNGHQYTIRISNQFSTHCDFFIGNSEKILAARKHYTGFQKLQENGERFRFRGKYLPDGRTE